MTTQMQKDKDPDIINSEKAMLRAAKAAQEKARRYGHGVMIYKDGKVVEWLPETGIKRSYNEGA